MKLNFEYNVDSELKRVMYTLGKRDFYIENGYKVSVPEGVSTKYLAPEKETELKEIITNELEEKKVEKFQKVLTARWKGLGAKVEEFLDSLPYSRPNELYIVFTQYGTGGSYGPPNKIIMNIHSTREAFETSVHELIHDVIEIPVVQHFKLTHWEKESLVEYLIIKHLNEIFPKYIYRNDNKPSAELLKKVGFE